MKDLISIIVPVYGDKRLVKMFYDNLTSTINNIDANFEIIMVCDACPYNSGEEIQKLAQIDNRVKFIDLMTNVGQHLAIKAGIDYASGDYTIVMDCDLQDKPSDIIKFYNEIKKGEYDVILGYRKARKVNFFKKLFSSISHFLLNTFNDLNFDDKDHSCGNYSVFNKEVLNSLKKINEQYFVFNIIIIKTGYNRGYIEVEQDERPVGRSGYNFLKGLKLFTRTLVNNSNKPLIFAAYCSFIMFILCFLSTIKLVINYFCYGKPLLGWTSLMCTIFLVSGLLFAYLGLLGIYIGQVFRLAQNRPLYIVKRKINL